MAVGIAYHVANGVFFGAAYALVVREPSWWSGALWGVGLEAVQLTIYPGWLSIRAVDEFAQVSASAHLVYGIVLGTSCRRLVAAVGR